MAEEKITLDKIKFNASNANKGTERGHNRLEAALRNLGWGGAGTLDKNNTLIGGNQSTEVASDIGMDEAVIIDIDGSKPVYVRRTDLDLSDPESSTATELAIALNRIAAIDLEWDAEVLLQHLADEVPLNDFFREDELDEIFKDIDRGLETPGADTEPQTSRADELQAEWNTQLGQLWQCGPHRVICGDCTDSDVVDRLMGGARADAVITDPPYGMGLDASYSNSLTNHSKGAKASRGYNDVIGDNDAYDPSKLLALFDSTSEHFWFGADYYIGELGKIGSWFVWDKRASVEDVDYSSSEFELCWSKQKHHRKMIRVPWFGIIGMENQDTKIRVHPTQKPLGVYDFLINGYVEKAGVIVDPYIGSGTTLIAAHNLNRICYGCEISPAYVAVILQRYLDHTGTQPERIEG